MRVSELAEVVVVEVEVVTANVVVIVEVVVTAPVLDASVRVVDDVTEGVAGEASVVVVCMVTGLEEVVLDETRRACVVCVVMAAVAEAARERVV
jgi:hypothetical protein